MRKIDNTAGEYQSGGGHGQHPMHPTFRPEGRGAQGAGSVFEDDVMLPDQYFARLRSKADYPGEQRLLLAVLEDAVHCFQTNMFARTPRRRHLFEEAEEWLLEDDVEASVTFDSVCDVFGLDVHYVRAGLRRWRDRQRPPAVAELSTREHPRARGATRDRDETAAVA